ncbi:MAG TPA: ferritin-like domain-containing protein [Vicinamibacterales bacterium]
MAETSTLREAFVEELRDVYDAEKQITKALPKMIKSAETDDLREALETHLEETQVQIERLDQVFEMLDMRPRGIHCEGMAGIIKEGQDVVKEHDGPLRDAAMIAAAQRVEHYEIAVYGTLASWARQLGLDDAAELLHTTLEEERQTDEKLTGLAESHINEAAAVAEPVAAGPRRGRQERAAAAANRSPRRR